MEWAKNTYNTQYENWVPWLEDIYLRWFTKDNKASYTTRRTLVPPPLSPNITTSLLTQNFQRT